jgi:integrase
VIAGELKVLLDDIAAYKTAQTPPSKVRVLALLVNEKGERLTAAMPRNRFDDARDAARIDKALFQFRDLRAKAATDTDDVSGTRSAQALLGHTTETMTSDYIRHKVGKTVRLLK